MENYFESIMILVIVLNLTQLLHVVVGSLNSVLFGTVVSILFYFKYGYSTVLLTLEHVTK